MRIEERTLLRRFASCIVLSPTTMQMCSRWWIIAFALVGSFAGRSYAQQLPEEGGREVQLWTGGGHTVPGGTKNTSVWNLGLRYGWILTRPHGPGFLKGRFEYAVDAVPLFLVFQPANTSYGAGFNPIDLKWNFATRSAVVPYLEIDGGTLFTNHTVPTGTNAVNFTTSGVFGFHFLGERHAWSIEARYMHISNAGLATLNPGINTFQVRLGIGKFLARK
jgi:lipid A 3-O-deacylase